MAENRYQSDHSLFFKLAFKQALNATRRTMQPLLPSGFDRTTLNARKAA